MANKQIYQLDNGTFDGDSFVAMDVENTDPATQAQYPYLTKKTKGDAVALFVVDEEQYTQELNTTAKTVSGAINELYLPKGTLISGTDLNNLKDCGIYWVPNSGITNVPVASAYGLLEVFRAGTTSNIIQRFTRFGTNNVSTQYDTYIREYANSQWYQWRNLLDPFLITLSVVETGNMTINENTSCSIGNLVIISIRFTVTNPINGGRLIINGLPKSISNLGSGTSFMSLSSSRKDNGFTVANYTSDAGIITMDTLSAQSYCLNGIYIKE